MFTIGEFARYGRVSVRMLRHCDSIGIDELRGTLVLRRSQLREQLDADTAADIGARMVNLPEVRAATILHRGPMDDVMQTVQALAQWVDANEYRSTGFAREVYLESPMDNVSAWVTELQNPLIEAGEVVVE
ncbi:MerR family transcriptional regulator [Rathayibacter soli]|uniref:MerR family transcriptional regulator n=1 Tax=Rathayibacter soli TaxID=3144168 RepID=UPI0027E5B709|nr:MerR family transcriptional regulator [Glaciibacter superstes]